MGFHPCPDPGRDLPIRTIRNGKPDGIILLVIKFLGDYSNGVPPLPIPNREVKPISADGTAFAGE
jgi:hypothetical protein